MDVYDRVMSFDVPPLTRNTDKPKQPTFSSRAPKAGRSLAEMFPHIAAQWHEDFNGPEARPDSVGAKVARIAWWQCAQGHVWCENVSVRTNLPQWKMGDVAACPYCTGFRTSDRCEHELPWHDEEDSHYCQACRNVKIKRYGMSQEIRRRGKINWEEDYAMYKQLARIELQRSSVLDHVPAAWYAPASSWIVQQAAFMAASAKADLDMRARPQRWAQWAMQCLVPSQESLELDIAAQRGSRRRNGSHDDVYWSEPLLAVHGVSSDRSPWLDTQTSDIAEQIKQHLGSALPPGFHTLATAHRTRLITQTVCDWLRAQGASSQREAVVPISENGAGHSRIDIVALCQPMHDIAIEIDSTHKAWSIEKLRYAQQFGAAAIWIRHGTAVRDVEGVETIDLKQCVPA